ncbi:MAG TPA: SAM-dependent methyltransferase, partial [Deltaproteobacteria bacterium]|nr:SAM-dependent methyltransferase [Deltaproteobacteria bacterium]
MDWPNEVDARLRYDVMLDMMPPAGPERVTLADLGCGAGHMLTHMREAGLWPHVGYHGVDLSPVFIALCRAKFPGVPFLVADAIATPESLPMVDFTILNGVFTVKRALEFEEMWGFVRQLLVAAWSRTRHALSFNVMSKQ